VPNKDNLVHRLKRREGQASVELHRHYSPKAATIINRLNGDWITQRILEAATQKAMSIVVETIGAKDDDMLDSVSLEELVDETSALVGLELWRRFNGLI